MNPRITSLQEMVDRRKVFDYYLDPHSNLYKKGDPAVIPFLRSLLVKIVWYYVHRLITIINVTNE